MNNNILVREYEKITPSVVMQTLKDAVTYFSCDKEKETICAIINNIKEYLLEHDYGENNPMSRAWFRIYDSQSVERVNITTSKKVFSKKV
jgi:hypothetical protein